MAEEEVVVDPAAPTEADSAKKYVTGTFDSVEDEKFLARYNLLRNVGGYNNKEVIMAGVEAMFASPDFKGKVQQLQGVLK
jgi:hypothetical protein